MRNERDASDAADPDWEDPIDMIRMTWRVGKWQMLRSIPEDRLKESNPGLVALAKSSRGSKAIDFINVANGRTPLFRNIMQLHQHYDVLFTPTLAPTACEVGHNTPPDGRFGDEWFK
jgi:aspartyl-tRNA(Asn)/glutamyl-tRNA(Gln) amidotransferase subunit A